MQSARLDIAFLNICHSPEPLLDKDELGLLNGDGQRHSSTDWEVRKAVQLTCQSSVNRVSGLK
jgi:hypothetical protein